MDPMIYYTAASSMKQLEYVKAENNDTNENQDDPKKAFLKLVETMSEEKAQRDKKTQEANMRSAQMRREREKKAEERRDEELRRLRKKRMKIWFKKRAEHREDYTEFLETGKRYATPCPAAEMLAAMRSMSNFLGI